MNAGYRVNDPGCCTKRNLPGFKQYQVSCILDLKHIAIET